MVPTKRLMVSGTTAAATLLFGLAYGNAQQEGAQDAARQDRQAQQQQQRAQDQERDGAARQRGQQEGRDQQRQARGQQQHGEGNLDAALAKWLILENEGEIQISEFGQQRSQNERVQKFSQTAVQDHTQFVQKLQQFAGAQGAAGQRAGGQRAGEQRGARDAGGAGEAGRDAQPESGQRAADGQRGEAARRDLEGADRAAADAARDAQAGGQGRQADRAARDAQHSQAHAAGGHGQSAQLLKIKQEVGNQKIESAQQALGEKQGAEFDKAYMTKQVALHMDMLATLEVFSNHVSPEMQQVLQQGQEKTQQHLQQAKEILQSVEQEQTR